MRGVGLYIELSIQTPPPLRGIKGYGVFKAHPYRDSQVVCDESYATSYEINASWFREK